jgi:hypothetical protein
MVTFQYELELSARQVQKTTAKDVRLRLAFENATTLRLGFSDSDQRFVIAAPEVLELGSAMLDLHHWIETPQPTSVGCRVLPVVTLCGHPFILDDQLQQLRAKDNPAQFFDLRPMKW